MTAHSLPITKSHFLRKLHEREIQHLEWKRELFQQRFEGLERQVGQPRDVYDKRAIEQTIAEVNTDIQAIHATLQNQAAFALREKARLGMELALLEQEGQRLKRLLDEALLAVRDKYERIEQQTAIFIGEMQAQQKQIGQNVEDLYQSEIITLAQKRQTAYHIQCAQEEAMALCAWAQLSGDEWLDEVKELWQSRYALKLVLAHMTQHQDTLTKVANMNGYAISNEKNLLHALFLDLIIAPSSTLSAISSAAATQLNQQKMPHLLAKIIKRLQKKRQQASQASQAGWKWLMVPLLTLALSSSMMTYYAGSQDDLTLSGEKQDALLAKTREPATIPHELAELSALLSKFARLSTKSKALSSSYVSQAFSSLMEPEDRRAFLQVESQVNQLFQADIKPGQSDLSLLNSNPIAQDRLPLGNGDSLLPDGLWLKQEAAVHQDMPTVPVEESTPAEEPTPAEITPEPVVQNTYLSPTTGTFRWPTTGPISQGPHRHHMALDIAVPFGTPILAADGGQVVQAGWNNSGYGNLIVIDHQNGYQTYYAHLSSFAVQVGATVNQGSLIGQVGSTGNSTGPHLHFEIRLNNILKNPFNFLY